MGSPRVGVVHEGRGRRQDRSSRLLLPSFLSAIHSWLDIRIRIPAAVEIARRVDGAAVAHVAVVAERLRWVLAGGGAGREFRVFVVETQDDFHRRQALRALGADVLERE